MGDLLASPAMQWGFAGVCAVLLGLLGWIMRESFAVSRDTRKELVRCVRDNSSVIAGNTETIRTLCRQADQEATLLGDIRDKLLERPCLMEPPDRNGRSLGQRPAGRSPPEGR